MNKFKMILLIIVVVVLVDFAWENSLASSEAQALQLHPGTDTHLSAGLYRPGLGLVVGWVGHALRVRKKRRQADAAQALSQEQQTQQAQQSQ